jgi:hypothetical protein
LSRYLWKGRQEREKWMLQQRSVKNVFMTVLWISFFEKKKILLVEFVFFQKIEYNRDGCYNFTDYSSKENIWIQLLLLRLLYLLD